MSDITKFQNMINESNNIVFFGGAGVSTASGIPDFRSSNGLYTIDLGYKYKPEEMLSRTFYETNTEEFFKFYKEKMLVLGYKPCITHKKLVELEDSGKLSAIITQNIDGLHQIAGSKNVIELHGTIYKNYCTKCGKEFNAGYIQHSEGIPKCTECNSTIKPYVVLYEEKLPEEAVNNAINKISEADMLIIAGTSLSVHPAATFIDYFSGKYIVVINKCAIDKNVFADLTINDDMNKIFSEITVDKL